MELDTKSEACSKKKTTYSRNKIWCASLDRAKQRTVHSGFLHSPIYLSPTVTSRQNQTKVHRFKTRNQVDSCLSWSGAWRIGIQPRINIMKRSAMTSPWSSHGRWSTRKPDLIYSLSPSVRGRFIWRLSYVVIELPVGEIHFQAPALALSTTRRWSLGSFVGSAPLKLCKKGRRFNAAQRAEAISSSKIGKQAPQYVIGSISSSGCKLLEGTSRL